MNARRSTEVKAIGLDDVRSTGVLVSTRDIPRRSSDAFIKVALESHKHLPNHLRLSQVGNGVGNGVVVLEFEQWRELFLVEFMHADFHILRKYEIEKRLLFAVEVRTDRDPGVGRPSPRG